MPLLATQILWINLLTDSAPALALGVDPAPDDVMRRPPRRSTDRIVDAEMWAGILAVGLVMAVVTLVALDLRLTGGLIPGRATSTRRARWRSRPRPRPALQLLQRPLGPRGAFRHLFSNAWLWAAVAVSTALQVAVVELPFMNDAFHTKPLSLEDWLVCAGLASVVLWAAEAVKLLRRAVSS